MSAATVLELARHELLVLIRTKRALAVSLMYLFAALLGGMGYVFTIRKLEEKVLGFLGEQGLTAEQAAEGLTYTKDEGFQSLLSWVAGAEIDQLASSLQHSIILSAFLWGSLAFLPYLILFTSFDVISSELNARSLTYRILRAHRTEIILGKLIAQTVLYMSITVTCSLAIIAMATALLTTFSLSDTFMGIIRVWLLLIPFGLCYLSVSTFASTLTRSSFAALLSALGILIGLRMLSAFDWIPEDHTWAPLRVLRFLSPANYQEGFWLAGLSDPAISSLAYLAFGAVFLGLAIFRLGARDL